jgi:hypothetical protein
MEIYPHSSIRIRGVVLIQAKDTSSWLGTLLSIETTLSYLIVIIHKTRDYKYSPAEDEAQNAQVRYFLCIRGRIQKFPD